jgi:hypothetical protein
MLMALLSILVLVAIKMHETKKLLVQETTSWYDKKGELTLSDIITAIRRSIWVKMYFSKSKNHDNNTDSLKITEKSNFSISPGISSIPTFRGLTAESRDLGPERDSWIPRSSRGKSAH